MSAIDGKLNFKLSVVHFRSCSSLFEQRHIHIKNGKLDKNGNLTYKLGASILVVAALMRIHRIFIDFQSKIQFVDGVQMSVFQCLIGVVCSTFFGFSPFLYNGRLTFDTRSSVFSRVLLMTEFKLQS